MMGNDLREARKILGEMWGLGRPLHLSEMGRALQLQGRDPGAAIREMERRVQVSGPVAIAVTYMMGRDPITWRLGEIIDPRDSASPRR